MGYLTAMTRTRLLALPMLLLALASAADARANFRTGLDALPAPIADNPTAWDGAIRQTGISVIRDQTAWAVAAPTRPANEENPNDPAYRWATIDEQVRIAARLGGQAMLNIYRAPTWAEGADRPTTGYGPCRRGDVAGQTPPCAGSWKPDHVALGKFGKAIATRYSGTTPDPLNPGSNLPEVTMYELWNESNYKMYLAPHCSKGFIVAANNRCSSGGTLISIEMYRRMLNAFHDGVKSVNPDARIIAGAVAPYSWSSQGYELDPQVFMRGLLCLGGSARTPIALSSSKCPVKAKFDAFSFHPYNPTGTPNAKAYSPDGGAIGNSPDLMRALSVAVAKRTVLPAGPKELLATEFAWATCPPCRATSDPNKPIGYPEEKAAAYTSETLYRLWASGVRMLVWFGLVDGPVDNATSGTSRWPSGLFFYGATPQAIRAKSVVRAFRFPIFAVKSGSKAFAWTMSPCRVPGATVTFQVRSNMTGRYETVATRRLPVGTDGVVKTPTWAIPRFTRDVRATVSGTGCATESSFNTPIAAK